MYCKHCGNQISGDSKFCSHCGGKIEPFSNPTTIKQQSVQDSALVENISPVLNREIFGIKLTKQKVGLYLSWVLLHLILLLIKERSSYAGDNIWPFEETKLKYYDYTEFLLYTLVPLLILIIVRIIKKDSNQRNHVVTKPKYDLTYQKDITPSLVGIFMIFLSIIYYCDGNEIEKSTLQILTVFALLIRIGVTRWVINIAQKLNRNQFGWGILSFLFPSLTLVIIGNIKKLLKNEDKAVIIQDDGLKQRI